MEAPPEGGGAGLAKKVRDGERMKKLSNSCAVMLPKQPLHPAFPPVPQQIEEDSIV
jgi:hypothetical protein